MTQAPTASSFVETQSISSLQSPTSSARVLFDFSATSPFELSVSGARLWPLHSWAVPFIDP
jgi:hypothetical protein